MSVPRDYPTIEHTVGKTPLVRLQRIPGEISNTILGKLEGNNPAGSVKDRPAMSMICLLYTSPSPRDVEESRMPSSA